MKQKRLRYGRPMSRREKFILRRKHEEEAEGARRHEEKVAARLENIRQRALCVQTNDEVRALCREVWSMRHTCPAAITLTNAFRQNAAPRGSFLTPPERSHLQVEIISAIFPKGRNSTRVRKIGICRA